MLNLYGVLIVCCVTLFVSVLSNEENYSNSWAVEVKGGHEAANALALKHGFINKGQVGSLDDMYHFVHKDSPVRERRSIHIRHPKHEHLTAEKHVSYVEQQVIKKRMKRDTVYTTPTDSKWKTQWYLHRASGHDMNIERAWEQDIIGRGSVVSILDDGIEHTHPDLKDAYDPLASYDFNSHDSDPIPRYDYSNENKHGTRCAGEVAANRNGKCGVGAAYGAKVGGVRMLDGEVTDVVEASSLSLNPQHIQIYSSSWGPSDDGATVDGPGPLAMKAFIDGVQKGRGGLGSLFVWAAGNGGRYGDSCNCDGYAVSPYTISVGSASERDNKPWYLEKCSSTIASTYSSGSSSEQQIVSTDLHGKCTAHHTGTSAAAPLAAGIIALALEANDKLTWRDIQYLLVYTSNPNYPHDDHWITNGVGLKVSHLYGFGIIDATALVSRARNWITVPPRINCTVNLTQSLTKDSYSVPNAPFKVKPAFPSDCAVSYIEHCQAFVTLKMLAGQRKDVSIKLTSPQGTESILLPYRKSDRHTDGLHNWPFMTMLTWGESPKGGAWSFVVNTQNGAKAQLSGLELVVHGTSGTPRALRNVPADCDPQCKGGCSAAGPQFCDDCKNFRLFSTLQCVEKCPKGTYQNHHMCIKCPEYCTECSDQNTCISCVKGAIRLDDGLCAEECPSLTFLGQDHMCIPCHSSCLSCNGRADQNCTECPGQLSLQNGQCVIRNPESCQIGQYFDHRALECRSCHLSCLNCTGKESDQCTACTGNYSLMEDGHCIDHQPVLSCEHGEYFDREASRCIPCPVKCASCVSNSSCTLCEDSLYLTTDKLCVEKCPNRTVTNNKTHTCLDTLCSEHCLMCFGASSDSCTTCEDGMFLFESSCVASCPEHTFVSGNTCNHCNESCASCSGPSTDNCISCSNGKFLHQNACLSSCPGGSVSVKDQCAPCPVNCAECSSETACDVCNDGLLLLLSNKKCVKKCPEGFVENTAKKLCQPCGQNCIKCSDPNSCLTCAANFSRYIPNRSCMLHCPAGYYTDSDMICRECKHPCSTCVGSATQCLTCGTGMAFDKSSNNCHACCNSDRAVGLPCCDCDASTTECVQKNTLTTQEPLVKSGVNNRFVLIGLGVMSIVALVIIILGLVTYVMHRRSQHSINVRKYRSLNGKSVDPLEIVDDSGSEAEIYTQKKKRGYTSVDTIDHDTIHQDTV